MARTTFNGPVVSENGFGGPTGHRLSAVIRGTAVLDFPSIAAAASADLTIAAAGAAVGDTVAPGLPAAPTAGIVFQMFVSAADTVTVRATNITGLAVDPLSATFNVTVLKTAA